MRTGVPIMLFVAVAGFHNAISASLEFDESNTSPEERVYEENVTTTQPDESDYAAAHVNVTEDILRATHMETLTDGETEALTYDTETKVLDKEDSDDGETEALTVEAGAHTGSDESVDKDSGEYIHKSTEQAEEKVKSTEDFSDEDNEET